MKYIRVPKQTGDATDVCFSVLPKLLEIILNASKPYIYLFFLFLRLKKNLCTLQGQIFVMYPTGETKGCDSPRAVPLNQ